MMELDQKYLQECFDYCPKFGILIWKNRPSHHFKTIQAFSITNSTAAGSWAGNFYIKKGSNYGCFYVGINGKKYLLHRVVWCLRKGSWPRGVIDHVNGNPLDNRIENLREVDQTTNLRNRQNINRNNKTGLPGVHVCHTGNYRITRRFAGEHLSFGAVENIEDAKVVLDKLDNEPGFCLRAYNKRIDTRLQRENQKQHKINRQARS